MGQSMLDLELLRSFVSVVDSGGFTRAGERVHRTQSTVSQQIKRLEDDLGQPLLNRTAKDVTPTEAGERLLSYARRLLSLAEEARDVMTRPGNEGAVRLGIPENCWRRLPGHGPVCGSTCAPIRAFICGAISNAASSIWRCSNGTQAKRAASRCGPSACTGSPARVIRSTQQAGRCP
jgi:hypothetical protein